jgi:hypothetical protein
MIDAHDSSKNKMTSQMGLRHPKEAFSGLGFHKVSGILMIKNYNNCDGFVWSRSAWQVRYTCEW